MSALRILHTESSLGWGGQENRTLNEMIAMRARGHRMFLACPPGARIAQRAHDEGFTDICPVPMRNVLQLGSLWRLRRYMAAERIDIVNTHSGRDTQMAALAARSLGLSGRRPRIVRTRHLALPITSRISYSGLPDHVVAVSQFVARYLASAGVPEAMITAVPTGIDFSRYVRRGDRGTLREELGLPASTLLIGTVAILRIKKGHDELLDAIVEVLRRFPDAHFVFAGDGPRHAHLAQRVADMQLQARVHLLGLRRDVVNVLDGLDLFVLPTHQEALGTAFIEAGVMGLPAIGTQVDGVPEVVVDGRTGLLVPAKDPAALATAIVALLADPERRAEFGRNARAWVETQYSREAMAAHMEALYLRLLQA